MTVHYSVTLDFDSTEPYSKAQIYDIFKSVIEDMPHGVMTACDTWMEDDDE